MEKRRLLYAGSPRGRWGYLDFIPLLEKGLSDVEVSHVSTGAEALAVLAEDPMRFEVVLADLDSSGLPEGPLVQGIREINPDIEIVLLGRGDTTWEKLDLPRFNRPILLRPPFNPDSVISCVAKLLDLVETKNDYAALSRGFRGHITVARRNVESVLAMLNRPAGVGMISMRRDGFITFYSPEARRLTGYTQDEVPHIRKWAEFTLRDPGGMQYFLTRISRFWSEGVGRDEMALRVVPKEGRPVKLSLSFLLMQDDRGEPRQLVILMFDPQDRANAEAFRLLVEAGPPGLYTYDHKEGVQAISKSAVRLINQAFDLNLEKSDVIGRLITDLPLPPETSAKWQEWLERAAAGSLTQGRKFAPLGLPGLKILEHTFVAPFSSYESGQSGVIALIATRHDLKAASYQGLAAPELCQATLMNLPHPFLLLKAERASGGVIKDFICIGANIAAAGLLAREDWVGKGLRLIDLFPDVEAQGILLDSLVTRAEEGGEIEFEIPTRLRADDDQARLVHFWVGKVGDGVALFFRDVTAKRGEEQILKQYRHIFAHMHESIIVTDLEGAIIDWNPASERMFGYSKDEILGRPTWLLTGNREGEPAPDEARDILREGDVWKGEYNFTRRDGRPGVAQTVFALLRDDQNEPYGTVGLSHDITDSKRLEERLTVRTRELQEKNLALNTLLRHAEEERLRACQQVASEVTSKINDGLQHILESKNNSELVDNLTRLLLQDLNPADELPGIVDKDHITRLTDKELEVARLIRLGKTTEEIAFILDKSPDTVRLQRISIRKKLGLSSRDRNLYKHLTALEMF